jgi:uncharacterized protein (DUF305 family)
MARLILAAAMLMAAAAHAADAPKPASTMPAMPGMQPPGMQPSGMPPSGMTALMQKMEQAMASAPMTGDPDHDFAAMMIPHHQGAIDMAIWELDHGHDSRMRKLAASIVKAQENEIDVMQTWLDKHKK